MIQSLYRTGTGDVLTNLDVEEIGAALRDRQGLVWVDFADEAPDSSEPILREVLNFHPLAVDDALEKGHIPKVDDWGQYVYVVLHAVAFEQQSDEPLQTLELDAFLGRNFLVTHQTQALAAVDRVWTACQRDERHLRRGSARLLYRLADELVTDYMQAVEKIDEAIDQIEDQVFDDPTPSMLERIFTLKRSLLRLRRVIAPQREVLNKLARGDYEVIAPEDRVFFRDVYDHLMRLHDITESLRDLTGSALDTYLSVISNRMNGVMKTLTVITTLFMPVSFLAGFFGMNFFQPVLPMDAWTGRTMFALALAAMVGLPAGVYLWIRRRAWM